MRIFLGGFKTEMSPEQGFWFKIATINMNERK